MPKLTPQALVSELREAYQPFSGVHRQMGEEVAFGLEGKQYRDQRGRTDDGNRVRPVDAGLFRLWRYKSSLARLKAPVHVNCEPRDRFGDADTAKSMKHALEWETTGQTWKGFGDVRDRWIGAALAMRVGVYRWDWRPDMGEFGEMFARSMDPRNFLFTNGYLTPHDPYCPATYEIFRMPIAQAQRMRGWKNTGGLKADDGAGVGAMLELASHYMDTPGAVDWEGSTSDDNMTDTRGGEGWFTGVMVHKRFVKGFEAPARQLVEAERFMECISCGWQGPPQGDVPEFQDGFRLPERMPNACRTCGGDLHQVTAKELDPRAKRAAQGKQLLILPLNGSVTEFLYEGTWQIPTARTFPYAWLTAYKFPHKAVPESDISLHWTVTVGRNFTLRSIYEQAHRARGLWLLPAVGLTDRNNVRYDLGDDQDDVAFYKSTMPPQGIENIAAPAVSAALFQLHAMLGNVYRENEGSSDLAMTQDQTKDIPVGTIEQLEQTGNVPIDDFIADIYAADSHSFGYLSDAIQYTWTPGRWVRFYGPDGKLMGDTMRGADMPDVDVSVSAGPSLSRVKDEEVETYSKLSEMPPARRHSLGQMLGVDRALLVQMDQDQMADEQWMLQRAARMGPAAAPTPNGKPSPNGAPNPARTQ